jgi:hypothetical protein
MGESFDFFPDISEVFDNFLLDFCYFGDLERDFFDFFDVVSIS